MSDKSPGKKGLFGWFGGKKSTKSEEPSEQEVASKEPDGELPVTEDTLSADESSSVKEPISSVTENAETEIPPAQSEVETPAEQPTKTPKVSFFQRLKQGLSKTRSQFSEGLANLVLGQKEIDEDILEEVETLLLMADVGVDTTSRIIEDLTDKANRKELKDTSALTQRLKELLLEIVEPVQAPLNIPQQDSPFVILMVGVNGVGKTTTIGKLAHQFQAQGNSVMLAAGDTFRAAAVEQLKAWGERNQVPVVAQHTGADSASVIYDAVEAAKARNIDIVIADTAGRLHNKSNLMEELSKVKRVMGKVDATAPHEVMLVVDAGTGQNALVQATEFNKSVALNSVTITKLDGTAKGGVVFALADKMKLPIRYIGVGESKEDLRAFNAADFIEALFEQ
ncbi:signal recognition particle-docking protein FtsY [Aliikangiella coralliicola]|uniref:Signal recognition particle receptor FtsY n=1 Tax=Aliikangiella coralliicola TaxID=2592383 RepID=A0A545UIE0_9GAMM|nr:signal recognition particle-docking protein FtsY [Aliikangiella coralliicola]TQV89231.1 signal recognition particle-docking protein FtsY [Aliikangiella coralliicola]